MNGYGHPQYAASLREFGTPRELPGCGGWILERAIPGSSHRDAIGCYPVFSCRDWAMLQGDLETLDGLVTLALVTDPFGNIDERALRQCFGRVALFKQHFIRDMHQNAASEVTSHHRYYARKALRDVQVEVCDEPGRLLDDWIRLYDVLIERHHITGLKAFSPAAFAEQLRIPGIVALRAISAGEVIGAHLWYLQGEVAYSHLAAANQRGYSLNVSYALYSEALRYFGGRARWLDLGAGAGIDPHSADGLTQFKRGWSTDTLPVYFCGRVFDKQRYDKLTSASGAMNTRYFPAYRQGELA